MNIYIFKTDDWGITLWIAFKSKYKHSAKVKHARYFSQFEKPPKHWVIETHKEEDMTDFFQELKLETLYQAGIKVEKEKMVQLAHG